MFRLLRTLRHLHPSQVLRRLRYARERRRNLAGGSRRGRWAWTDTTPPATCDDLPAMPVFHHPGPSATETLRGLARGVMTLHNQAVEIGRDAPDWRLGPRRRDRLWTVTLHYHSWVHALAEVARDDGDEADEAAGLLRHYLDDWLRRCDVGQPGTAALAWNSYAVATRLGWWARSYLGSRARIFDPAPEFSRAFLRSMWEQAAYLHDHLEWDLCGNHLLRDAVGLAWAGRLFRGPRPRSWLRTATDLALREAHEQVLADGGHYERSPMYHVEVMADLLSLALLLEDETARARLRRSWTAMAEHLAWMRHPDGEIPLFNDSALGGSCPPATMLGLGEHLGVDVDARPRSGGKHFPDTGILAWHGSPWTLFFDVGAVGPDHQPGHGHADTLSIEGSFLGRRLFVDPGTFAYDDDERRRYDRSTGAHNTVTIDDVDSSEVWHIFRVGRRARPLGVEVDVRPDAVDAVAAHDGYDHLTGRPRHRRRLLVDEGGAVTITDRIEGRGAHRLRGGLLVEPSWRVEPAGDGWRLVNAERRVAVTVTGPVGLERCRETRPYHPRFGVELEATRIGWRFEGPLPVEIRTVATSG
ncbi:MAG: hypothetical protein GY856_02335 [bacterium]|nr:hypothetical protein [bacterium]